MKLLFLLGLSGVLLSSSPAFAQVVTNGQPITIARKALEAAGYRQTGLDMLPNKPSEDLQCWSVGQGVLIIGYSKTSEAITGLGFFLSDERPKAFRKTFDFEVSSFDTATGLMVIRTERGEQDGPANRSQPVGPKTNRKPSAAGSGG